MLPNNHLGVKRFSVVVFKIGEWLLVLTLSDYFKHKKTS